MREMYLKVATVILALLFPLTIIYFFGVNFKSFSKCYGTFLEPLFYITNAVTSHLFFGLKHWKLPALFLMLLTVFSTDIYSDMHNLFAVAFFISVIYSLLEFKKLRCFVYLYCSSVLVTYFGLFWFEMWATYVICFYHLYLLKYQNNFHHSF